MKTYNDLIEELLEDSPVNSMGGGYDVGQASSNAGNLAGYDPVLGRTRRKKKIKEMFAGCPVFTVASEDYIKCMHGRMKYERWNKKLNMEEMDNQDIRTYAHRNPGKPVIIKDSTYGTMSYLIPSINESVELDEGKKTLRVQSGIGKSKHTVSFHDGKKKHKDGSPFYDIKIFKNKKDSEAFVQQSVKKGYRTESVELDEAWTADSVIKNAKIGSKKGYGINIKKGGGVTKTPYKHMLLTTRKHGNVRVTFDHGDGEFEGTPQSVALYINKKLGIKESFELDEAEKKKPMFTKRTKKMTPEEKQAAKDYYTRAGKPFGRKVASRGFNLGDKNPPIKTVYDA